MKIVILDGYAANPRDLSWDKFEALGELNVYDRTPAHLIAERIGDAEIVYTNKTPLTAETLVACPNIQFIGVLATGYNVVDIAAAKARGIVVTNIPGYSTAAAAQFAIALLLEICSHVGHHSDAVHAGRWEKSADFTFWDFPLIELCGKTIGIIGFGRIGQAVGRIAAAFGMKVLAYSRSQNAQCDAPFRYVSLEELLSNSDVISLHCPLTDKTQSMINRERIAKMKSGVILINNGRGGLIDETALAEALNTGKVYAAAVDVVSTEPIAQDNPLLKAKNCIITPHISWAAKETRERLFDIAADNLKQFLAGTPVNTVN